MAFRISVRTHSGPFWAIKEQKCFSFSKMMVCLFNDIQFSCPGWREENWLVVPECVQFCRDQLLIVRDSLRFLVVVFFPARWRSWSWRAFHLFGRKSSLYLSCSQLLFIYPCSKTSPWRVPLILGRAGKPWPYLRFVHQLYCAACNCNVVALYSNKTVLLNINKRYFNPIKSLHWKLP